jgi:hypothetical protein
LAEELVNRAEMVTFLKEELISALRDAAAGGDIDKTRVDKNIRAQVGLPD